jgi:hypothetical protein
MDTYSTYIHIQTCSNLHINAIAYMRIHTHKPISSGGQPYTYSTYIQVVEVFHNGIAADFKESVSMRGPIQARRVHTRIGHNGQRGQVYIDHLHLLFLLRLEADCCCSYKPNFFVCMYVCMNVMYTKTYRYISECS